MSEAVAPQDAVSEVAQLPALTEEESHFLVERVWRFFCSLRLTLGNMLGLFLAMIAGTFVNPANDSLANIERAFAHKPLLVWSYRTFELYDLFRSWWFTLLLLSLALNLIACSLERLPRIYFLVRYPTLRLEDVVGGLRFKAPEAETKLSADEVRRRLQEAGYRVQAFPRASGGADLFAERGRYARFGVWVVHISLLMVLGGGIVGRLTAFEGTAEVPQGGGQADAMIIRNPDGSAFRRKLGFIVKCDDFRLKEFSPGRVKAYESDLRVLDHGGRELARKTITVNDPLKFADLTFYQASFRQLDEAQRARLTMIDKISGARRELLVSAGEPIEAAEGLSYQLVDYAADYQGMGPAVHVVRSQAGPAAAPEAKPSPALTSFWVFAKAPGFDRDNREDRFAFSFERITPFFATGLQIAKDPSIPVIYTGCFLLFLGIGIAFYTAHKRVWARVENGKLALGGAAHRNQEAFSSQFAELTGKLLS